MTSESHHGRIEPAEHETWTSRFRASQRWQERALNLGAHVVLIAGALTMLLPLVWMVATAFKTSEETFIFPPTFIPRHFAPENLVNAWNAAPFARYYLNSTIVAVADTVLQCFFCSLAGYVFAKYRFRGRDALFIMVVAKLMIPVQVIVIPLYLITIRLHISDSLLAVILPDIMGAFGIFMLRQFIMGLPDELLDSARIDGASDFGIYWRIVLPLIRPALATFAIITFINSWNDFLWPLIVISSPMKRTLQLGLTVFHDQFVNRYNVSAAAAMITIVPIVIVFAIFQRRIVEGLAHTGLKEG